MTQQDTTITGEKQKTDSKHLELEKEISNSITTAIKNIIHTEKSQQKYGFWKIRKTQKRKTFKQLNKIRKFMKLKKLKTDIQELSKTDKNCIKWCIQRSWHNLRKRFNRIDQGKIRWYLILFAVIMIGKKKALKIKLPFLGYRPLVVKHHLITEMGGLDSALKILQYFRLEQPLKPKIIPEERIKDTFTRFVIELLWQGVPLQNIVKMNSINFDAQKNIIFINSGRAYRIASADKEFWARSEGLLKKLPEWFWSYKSTHPKTIEKYFIGRTIYRYINSVLRNAVKELNIPNAKVNHKNFRHAGLMFKIVGDNLYPACLSSFYGPELPTNILAPNCIYTDYKFDIKEHDDEKKPTKKNKNSDTHTVDKEESSVKYNGTLKKCRKILTDYEATRDKTKAKTELKILKEDLKSQKNLMYLVEWIESLYKKPGKKRSPGTLRRYFESLPHVFIHCEMKEKNICKLDEDDIIDIMTLEYMPSNNKECFVNAHTFRLLRTSLNSLYGFLSEKDIATPKINWNKLKKSLVDGSPRLIVLPEEDAVTGTIDKLSEISDPDANHSALIGIMGFYLGLRKTEIFSAETERVRILGEGENYLEVFGKGSKYRRVPLNLIPTKYRKIFMDAWKTAVLKNQKTILGLGKKTKITTLFDKYLKNAAPSGLHSLRHGFATLCSLKETAPIRIASYMGHETLRTFQNTYDQGLWSISKKIISRGGIVSNDCNYFLPEKLSQNQLYSFGLITETTVIKPQNLYSTRKPINLNAARKKRKCVNMVETDQVLKTYFDEAAERLSKIPISHRAKVLWHQKSIPLKRKEEFSQYLANALNHILRKKQHKFLSETTSKKQKSQRRTKSITTICDIFLKKYRKKRRTQRNYKYLLNKLKIIIKESGYTGTDFLKHPYIQLKLNKISNPNTRNQIVYLLTRLQILTNKLKLDSIILK